VEYNPSYNYNGKRFHPDCVIETNDRTIFIECDEQSHRAYNVLNEAERTRACFQLGADAIIRFNPDTYDTIIDGQRIIVDSPWRDGKLYDREIWFRMLMELCEIVESCIADNVGSSRRVIYVNYSRDVRQKILAPISNRVVVESCELNSHKIKRGKSKRIVSSDEELIDNDDSHLPLPIHFLLSNRDQFKKRYVLTRDLYKRFKTWCLENEYTEKIHISQFTYVIKCRFKIATQRKRVYTSFGTRVRGTCFDFRNIEKRIENAGLESFCDDLRLPVIEEQVDPCVVFVMENLDDIPKGWVLSSVVYDMFKSWCNDEGIDEVPSKNNFTISMKENFQVKTASKRILRSNGEKKLGRCLKFDSVNLDTVLAEQSPRSSAQTSNVKNSKVKSQNSKTQK